MRRRPQGWLIYVLAMGALTVVHAVASAVDGPLGGPVIFNLIGGSAVVAILVGAFLNHPARRLPWLLFALGQGVFVGGDIIAYNYTSLFGGELPYPSLADAFYLSVYPLLVAGLLILIHERTPKRDRAGLIDSLIMAIGAGVVSWAFLMAPYAHDSSLTLPTKLTSIAYPLMDLVLLTVTVRLAVGAGRRGRAFYLLAIGVVALLVTDSIFGWLLLHGGYEPGGVLDVGWAAFYILLGAAALHPSMRSLSEPSPDAEPSLTRRRLALLAGATFLSPAVQTIRYLMGEPIDVLVVTASTVTVFALVVARMAGIARRNEEAAERERALRAAEATLATATNKEEIYSAAISAAGTLVGDSGAVGLYSEDTGNLELVATTPEHRDAFRPHVRALELAPSVLEDLERRLVVQLPADDARALVERAPAGASLCIAPMLTADGLRGALATVATVPLSRAQRDSVGRLAAEVSLALESAALTEERLRRRSEARFRALFQHSSDVVTVLTADGTVKYVSPAVKRMLGRDANEVEGSDFSQLVHSDDVPRLVAFLSSIVHAPSERAGAIELRVGHRDDTWLDVEALGTNLLSNADVAGLVLNMRDVSERKAFEQQLAHQAFHDPLTGLPNRALFHDRVAHALTRQLRSEGRVGVLFMDVDDFKTVNDSLGHAAGDRLLEGLGQRITECIRSADTAARLGGDEFAILLDGVDQELEATEVAERVIAALERPFTLEGKEVMAHVSLGIAFGDADGRGTAEELLRNADAAMYLAKEQGKGCYQAFEPEMHAAALARLELKADLLEAIEKGQFLLHYQPIVALDSGRVAGVEALVRWQHPTRGLIPPLEFIPLAEDTGLIVQLGQRILEQACREAAVLQRLCPQDPPMKMSVNLSARQLRRPELISEVRHALDLAALPPDSLILELTESMAMENVDQAVLRMQELKNIGVRLAIDDFGTGHSSLNYIRQFPIDIVKIDRSFLEDIGERDDIAALTAAIVDLTHTLGLASVAEGIETEDQHRQLVALKCDFAQGYLFHRPLDAPGVEELVARQARSRGGLRRAVRTRARSALATRALKST